MLRQLCIVAAALVMARIAWDPRIVGDDVGTTPILNWLLWGYGVPAVSFWIGRRSFCSDAATMSPRAASIPPRSLFTALTAMLEIRHLMNDGDIYRPSAASAKSACKSRPASR